MSAKIIALKNHFQSLSSEGSSDIPRNATNRSNVKMDMVEEKGGVQQLKSHFEGKDNNIRHSNNHNTSTNYNRHDNRFQTIHHHPPHHYHNHHNANQQNYRSHTSKIHPIHDHSIHSQESHQSSMTTATTTIKLDNIKKPPGKLNISDNQYGNSIVKGLTKSVAVKLGNVTQKEAMAEYRQHQLLKDSDQDNSISPEIQYNFGHETGDVESSREKNRLEKPSAPGRPRSKINLNSSSSSSSSSFIPRADANPHVKKNLPSSIPNQNLKPSSSLVSALTSTASSSSSSSSSTNRNKSLPLPQHSQQYHSRAISGSEFHPVFPSSSSKTRARSSSAESNLTNKYTSERTRSRTNSSYQSSIGIVRTRAPTTSSTKTLRSRANSNQK